MSDYKDEIVITEPKNMEQDVEEKKACILFGIAKEEVDDVLDIMAAIMPITRVVVWEKKQATNTFFVKFAFLLPIAEQVAAYGVQGYTPTLATKQGGGRRITVEEKQSIQIETPVVRKIPEVPQPLMPPRSTKAPRWDCPWGAPLKIGVDEEESTGLEVAHPVRGNTVEAFFQDYRATKTRTEDCMQKLQKTQLLLL
ncbi:MAG: hypothetical protein GY852_04485, partial [bacterium]|nr:hypothetical protein [bacterium]